MEIFLQIIATLCTAAITGTAVVLWYIHGKIAALSAQVGRFASDLDSEKRTRAEVNDDFEQRIRTLERKRI